MQISQLTIIGFRPPWNCSTRLTTTIVSGRVGSVQPFLTMELVDTDNVYAVLHYIGAPDADPSGKAKNLAAVTTLTETDPSIAAKGGINLLDESDLVPLFNPQAPGGSAPADRVIDLNFHRDSDTGELEVCDLLFAIRLQLIDWILVDYQRH